jgi:hypothetical protein
VKIYLASRYSRREELCGYREQVQNVGHMVTSRWLNGQHQISDSGVPIGDHGERLVEGDDGSNTEAAARLRQSFAAEDFQDVLLCDLLIAFTEQPRSGASRGGRHVELGIALGLMKRVWIVGPRENIFCWLEDVRHFETWEQCLNAICHECSGQCEPRPAA